LSGLEDDLPPDEGEEGEVVSNVLPGDFRPRIELAPHNRASVVDAVITRLAEREVFQRGERLVMVRRDAGQRRRDKIRPDGNPEITQLADAALSLEIGKCARFFTRSMTKDGLRETEVAPPEWLVATIRDLKQWSFIRPLRGISEWPVMRPNGSLATASSYDTESQYLNSCDLRLSIPDAPTMEDARCAIESLLEVIVDFPFANQTIGEAVWLAMLLTPICRPAIDGLVPFFFIDANHSSTGKSLSADATGYILCGNSLARYGIPVTPEEWDKALLSIGLGGFPIILLDNAKTGGVLGSPHLDAALTGTTYTSRLLGKSLTVSVPMQTMFIATVNGGSLSGDLAGRSLHIQLESQTENPGAREGFRHFPLPQWIKSERARLLSCALTVLKAYHVAGCPPQKMAPWSRYEEWNRTVRAPLIWAGVSDPYISQADLKESYDPEDDADGEFIRAWYELFESAPQKVRDAMSELAFTEGPDLPAVKRMRDALLALCGAKDNRLPSANSVGRFMRRLRNKRANGLVMRLSKDASNTALWACQKT
jgi:hypothetical protein